MVAAEKKLGKHAFDMPIVGASTPHLTFSVGVFEWVPAGKKIGKKKGKAKVRVSGASANPEAVYAKAREIVADLDAGTYTGPKNVRVK